MELLYLSILILTVISAVVFIVIQYFKHKKDKSEWEHITEQKCRQIKNDSYEYARQTIDKISDVKQEYENKSDHEILVDVILALAAHSRRIDRIDDKLDCIYNYNAYIDSMNTQAKKLSEICVALNDKTNELNDIFSLCRTSLQNTANDVNVLNQHFSDTIKLEKSIEKCTYWFFEYTPKIKSMGQQVEQILHDMEKVIAACDRSPIAKLNNIENITKNIDNRLDKLHTEIEEINSDMSTIKSEIDEYGYDNLYCKIDTIKSSISEVDSSVDEIKYTISQFSASIDEINSAVSEYGYNSLYSKIDELKSIISG